MFNRIQYSYITKKRPVVVTSITSCSPLILLSGPPTDTSGIPILPIDPLLSTNGIPTLPSLLPSEGQSEPSVLLKLPTSIIAKGMPPMPTKVLEKIRDGNTLTYQPCWMESLTKPQMSLSLMRANCLSWEPWIILNLEGKQFLTLLPGCRLIPDLWQL